MHMVRWALSNFYLGRAIFLALKYKKRIVRFLFLSDVDELKQKTDGPFFNFRFAFFLFKNDLLQLNGFWKQILRKKNRKQEMDDRRSFETDSYVKNILERKYRNQTRNGWSVFWKQVHTCKISKRKKTINDSNVKSAARKNKKRTIRFLKTENRKEMA